MMITRTIFLFSLFTLLLSGGEITGPRPPANPGMGLDGASGMHGDVASTDTTPLAGPGTGPIRSSFKSLFAACSTMLIRKDGRPMVLCTNFIGRAPVIYLLERSGKKAAKLTLSSGSLLGGVYAYLDNENRLVMVDAEHNLIRVKAAQKKLLLRTIWELSVDSSVSLADAVTGHCGGANCDAVVSINPGDKGVVWFVTKRNLVGTYDPAGGQTHTLRLGEGETIHNSFSTAEGGRAAVATDHALYLLEGLGRETPRVAWRHAYERGSARKPGQLSHGTGATPTFFGPETGSDYITISDNADGLISLLVLDAARDGGRLICSKPLFAAGASGTENSAIGIGQTVIVASTYGYPYPAYPDGAGESIPAKADFPGGLARYDVRADRSGCDLVWENTVRSAAVPKYSTADELIYTVERKAGLGGNGTTAVDSYHFTVLDPLNGEVLKQKRVGGTLFRDPLQMAGNIGLDGVYWQGVLGGVMRIAPD